MKNPIIYKINYKHFKQKEIIKYSSKYFRITKKIITQQKTLQYIVCLVYQQKFNIFSNVFIIV